MRHPPLRRRATAMRTGCVAEPVERRSLLSVTTEAAAVISPLPTVVAGSSISLTVQLQDTIGNVNTDDESAVSITPVYEGSRTTGPSRSVYAVHGYATFTAVPVTVADETYFRITVAELYTPGSSPPFLVTAGPAAALAFAGLPTDVPAGAVLTDPYVDPVHDSDGDPETRTASPHVVVSDAYGNPTNVAVPAITVASTDGHSAVAAGTATPGAYTFATLALTAAASQTLTASAAGLTPAASDPITVEANVVAGYAFAAAPAAVVAGGTFTPVTVLAVDAFGNVSHSLDGQAVSSDLSLNGKAGTATAGTIQNGQFVVLTGTAPTVAGTYGLQVSDARVVGYPKIPTAADPVTVVAGPATQLKLVAPTGYVYAEVGKPFGPLTVQGQDAYGNPAAIDGTRATATAVNAANDNGVPLGGSPAVAVADGGGIFADLSIGSTGTFDLSFADGSLAPASAVVVVRPPLLAATTVTAGSPLGIVTVDVAAYLPQLPVISSGRHYILLQLEGLYRPDGSGRPLNFYPTIRKGTARVRLPALTKAGTYQLSGEDRLGDQFTQTVTVTAAAAAKLTVDVDPTAPSVYARTTVLAFDRFGNPATTAAGLSVTVAYAPPGHRAATPTLGGTTTLPIGPKGYAQFLDLTYPVLGAARLVATAPGLRPAVSPPLGGR